MNALEDKRKKMGMSIEDFATWLGITFNTYQKVISGYVIAKNRKDIDLLNVAVFLKIQKKTGLYLNDILPNHPIVKLIKK